MPHIRIKTKHINKLKEFGIYDQWLYNTKSQWNYTTNCSGVGSSGTIDALHLCEDAAELIYISFCFSNSPEGGKYWCDMYTEIKNK